MTVLGAVISFVAASGAAVVVWLNWWTAKTKRDADIMIFICNTLQSDATRRDRRRVARVLSKKPFETWNRRERDIAENVAMRFDIAMKVAKRSKWARDTLVSDWARPAVLSWRVIEPLINARRKVGPENLWHDFGELQQLASVKYPDLWKENIGQIPNLGDGVAK